MSPTLLILGQGAITRELLNAAGRLDAVELDRDLIKPLAKLCAPLGDLRIHNCDALKFNFCSLAEPERPLRVVGNLPYNISTPILFHLLDNARCIKDMHFMLQREVVERMGAEPGWPSPLLPSFSATLCVPSAKAVSRSRKSP